MDELLTVAEAAELAHVSTSALYNYRYLGAGGPKSGKIGRRIFYRRQDVLDWRDADWADTRTGRQSA